MGYKIKHVLYRSIFQMQHFVSQVIIISWLIFTIWNVHFEDYALCISSNILIVCIMQTDCTCVAERNGDSLSKLKQFSLHMTKPLTLKMRTKIAHGHTQSLHTLAIHGISTLSCSNNKPSALQCPILIFSNLRLNFFFFFFKRAKIILDLNHNLLFKHFPF